MKEIVLIGCGKSKLPTASRAKDLYQGDLFRKSWLVAEKDYPKADRYILSAKHFLLDPEKTIDPYDETLNGKRVAEKKAWAQKVISQLIGKGYDLKKDQFIFYAGDDYTRYLISPEGPIENFKSIYNGFGGIGFILQGLNAGLLQFAQNFQGSHLESVANLRNLLSNQNFVKKEPGVYRLWVKEGAAISMLNNLKTPVVISRILKRKIQTGTYLALYFGMSKNLFDRLKWHILQQHDPSTAKNGTISTLRHTLSAVLFMKRPLTQTETDLNKWMDDNCYFEWENLAGISLAKYVEDVQLKRNCYPLNIQDNHNIPANLRKEIKNLRKDVKK